VEKNKRINKMKTNLGTWLMIGGISIMIFMVTAHIKIYVKDDPTIYKDFALIDILQQRSGTGFLSTIGTKLEFKI
jgi:hypothetical protein